MQHPEMKKMLPYNYVNLMSGRHHIRNVLSTATANNQLRGSQRKKFSGVIKSFSNRRQTPTLNWRLPALCSKSPALEAPEQKNPPLPYIFNNESHYLCK